PNQQEVVSPQPAEHQEAKLAPIQFAAYIWLGGASVMAVYSIVQYLILRRRLAEAVLLREEIYLADRISSPFVMGILRPRIYLPSSTPMMERRFIVAHERHHIRRGDPVWKLLGYIALCLHWFNPLVWLAFCLAGKDMEMSCDEAVIKRLGEHIRADYSQALLRLATHKRMVSGMPLAFGEGDTKGRVRNMAKWKKPKVWVSALCAALCLVILAACALNPKQKETETDGETQIVGPARIVIRDFRFRIPAGCITEKREKKTHEQTDDGLDVAYWEFIDGESIIGGVNTFRIPENLDTDNWDWLQELDLPEWQDETLGYSAGGAPGNEVTVEFFSDVPEGQERTVLNEHTLYFYEGWIYDLWFDKLTVKPEVMKSILDTVSLGEPKPNPTTLPYEIGELPQGYDAGVTAEGNILIDNLQGKVGFVTSYPIPEGVYDPNDGAYLWLEDVGVPDLEDPNLYVAGVFSWKGSNSCSLTVEDDAQNPTVKRTHYFQVAGNTLYDFWLDDLAVDEAARSAIQKAVVYQEPVMQQPGTAPESEMSEEDIAFAKAQAVMMGLQDVPALIQTECRYQNTPEKDYIETFCYDSELGFLRVTTTADGLDYAQLYVNDRYYTNAGSETSPEPIWVESEAPSEFSSPWLGSFNFIRHYVTYVDKLLDGEKTRYVFQINAPFEDTPDAANVYAATFDFDAEGNFIDVYLQINILRDDAYTLTQSIVTTDPQVIATKLDFETIRAAK
ncbi:MAG: M56 family metallopeptidase, partial [Clostridiales bacterium]|nr:M56 family metallopeptidase [Clostridiales bacterium]